MSSKRQKPVMPKTYKGCTLEWKASWRNIGWGVLLGVFGIIICGCGFAEELKWGIWVGRALLILGTIYYGSRLYRNMKDLNKMEKESEMEQK